MNRIHKHIHLILLAIYAVLAVALLVCVLLPAPVTGAGSDNVTDNGTPITPVPDPLPVPKPNPLPVPKPGPMPPPLPVMGMGGFDCGYQIQVASYNDDAFRRLVPDSFSIVNNDIQAGAVSGAVYRYGGGIRFQNLPIENGEHVGSAILLITPRFSESSADAMARISAEYTDNATDFSGDNGASFDVRYSNHTTAVIDWDNMPTFTENVTLQSPDFANVIQEIVDRPGWVSGNSIVIFWEDFDDRSSHGARNIRGSWGYNGDSGQAAILCLTVGVPDCPDSLTLADLGGTSVNYTWPSVAGAVNYLLRYKRNGIPDSVIDGEVAYYGPLTSGNLSGFALEITKYGWGLWAHNDAGYSECYRISFSGGEAVVDSIMIVLPLAAALILMLISFFLKSVIIKIAIICLMWAVFIEPQFKDTWVQAAAILIIIWAGLSAFLRAKEKGGI